MISFEVSFAQLTDLFVLAAHLTWVGSAKILMNFAIKLCTNKHAANTRYTPFCFKRSYLKICQIVTWWTKISSIRSLQFFVSISTAQCATAGAAPVIDPEAEPTKWFAAPLHCFPACAPKINLNRRLSTDNVDTDAGMLTLSCEL